MQNKTIQADTWNSDIETPIGKFLNGMYYYLIRPQDIKNGDSAFLGNCSAVNSCWFSPILDTSHLVTFTTEYDTDRFGKLNNGTLPFTPKLERITGLNSTNIDIGEIEAYPPVERDSYKNPNNESRLLNYPYSFGYIHDGFNIPYEVKYHENLIVDNKIKVKSKAFLSDKGTYSIFLDGNKGDYWGTMESNINTAPLDIPVSSSAYSNWSSTQKAQDNFNTRSALMTNTANMNATNMQYNLANNQASFNTGVNAITSLARLDIGGVAKSFVNSHQEQKRNNLNNAIAQMQGNLNKEIAIGQKSAMQKDLQNTPRTMISTGSDVCFSMYLNQKSIKFFRYGISEEYRKRLCDYFTMYGYKQSRLMSIDLRSRKIFNYIKTIGCNMKSKEKKTIPMVHLMQLKNIFDNGVTIWHIDTNGGRYIDYVKDNTETTLY